MANENKQIFLLAIRHLALLLSALLNSGIKMLLLAWLLWFIGIKLMRHWLFGD